MFKNKLVKEIVEEKHHPYKKSHGPRWHLL